MLRILNVTKSYTDGQPVLRNVSLEVVKGEVLCILGPSGCGKSTLLRMIAGLEQAEQGELQIDGRDLSTIPVHRRNFGLMFQDFALFPHRTVAENIAFGLRMAGWNRQEIDARVAEVLELVSLSGYADRSIFALSGGERQRVALARSLAPKPRLLMLDEPLGSLDRTLRDELVTELRSILDAIQVTAIYVTHDQQEAFTIADRLVVMRQGEIVQIDVPSAVYQQPANAFVARFLGFQNLLSTSPFAKAPGREPSATLAQPTADRLLLLRPDAVTAIYQGEHPPEEFDGAHWIAGDLQQLMFLGATYRLVLKPQSSSSTDPSKMATTAITEQLVFEVPTIRFNQQLNSPMIGDTITLVIDEAAMSLIPH